jgi:anaerobic C4-dicarboxylate transporter
MKEPYDLHELTVLLVLLGDHLLHRSPECITVYAPEVADLLTLDGS